MTYWEITLADNSIVKEPSKFNLEWETPGKVRKFELIGDKTFGIDLTNGEFNIDGKKEIPINGAFGEFGLRFFKRNIVISSIGNTLAPASISSKVIYFLGYKKGNIEKLLKFDPGTDKYEYASR